MSFKINYKGTSCRGTLFDYTCNNCGHEQQATHPASEDPVVCCDECCATMNKRPTAPSFDADHHDSMMSHNLGWDGHEEK